MYICVIFDLLVTFSCTLGLGYNIHEGSEKEIIMYNKLGDVLLHGDLNAKVLQQMMTTCIYQCMICNKVLVRFMYQSKMKMFNGRKFCDSFEN